MPCCGGHIAWAEHVAAALGFKLQVTITHPADGDDTEQRFSLLELK